MSEFCYFCVFCDTIVKRTQELREHLSTHFTTSDGNQCQKTISKSENTFIENTIEYQKDLKNGFQLKPKELPNNNVSQLLIGCPVCDAIIRCYQLIVRRDKSQCICGEESEDMDVFECEDCKQTVHFVCNLRDYDSVVDKCMDCSSKAFKISYLKCETYDEQRDHCYRHYNYYPFSCAIDSCGQKFFTVNSSKTHLEDIHNFETGNDDEVCDVLGQYYKYKPIEQIDDYIDSCLKAKTIIQTDNNNINLFPMITLLTNDNIAYYGTNAVIRGSSKRKSDKMDHYMNQRLNESHEKQKRFGSHQKKSRNRCEIDFSLSDNSQKTIDHFKYERLESQTLSSDSNTDYNDSDRYYGLNSAPIDMSSTQESYSEDWFRQIKPTKSPYFPQKDDELVYIPFGHYLYKEEILKRRLYNQSNSGNCIRFFINDIIRGKISKIDFIFKPTRNNENIRLIYITFRPYERKYGTVIHLKYHDFRNVLDFVVLQEIYDKSVAQDWKIGDKFRSIVDDKYWFGTITGFNPAEYCRTSKFKYYEVKWTNGETDYLSPWDIETTDGYFPQNGRTYVKVTDQDRRQFFISHPEEWPKRDENKECKRVANGLKMILTMDKAKEFGIMDDINGYTGSRYREKILYPIDLKTIIARVENHYYRTHTAMKYDLKFILANIKKLVKSVQKDPEFKFEESVRKKLKYNSKFVIALCLIFIDSHWDGVTNPYDLYHNIDDYIENHDVSCYSAKRVHLNHKRKNDYLPVPWRRTIDYVPRGRGIRKGAKKLFSIRQTYQKTQRSESCSSAQFVSNEDNTHYDSQSRNDINFEKIDRLLESNSDEASDSDREKYANDSDEDSDYRPTTYGRKKYNLLSDRKSNKRKYTPKKRFSED